MAQAAAAADDVAEADDAADAAAGGAAEAPTVALDDVDGDELPEQAASARVVNPPITITLTRRMGWSPEWHRTADRRRSPGRWVTVRRAPCDRFAVYRSAMPADGDPIRPGEPPVGVRPSELTAVDVRWLAWHEARSHALVGREVRDLGDAILLHDPTDREPFWNRLAGIAWPSDAAAFDRRLAEALALFAGLDRIPHVWPTPGYDEPADLVERLIAHGFEDHGRGMLMLLDAARAARCRDRGDVSPGVTIERFHRLGGDAASAAAKAIGEVLTASFGVDAERLVAIELEAVQGLQLDAYHAILIRVDGRPAAVARRTTFGRASYLSSIGTHPLFRRRGLGRLVTALAAADAHAEGSRLTYLGVFEENTVARRLYDELGFTAIGGAAPDLLLRR
jgi:ribosomal protein S18 acetylase RimI-like enzyme